MLRVFVKWEEGVQADCLYKGKALNKRLPRKAL